MNVMLYGIETHIRQMTMDSCENTVEKYLISWHTVVTAIVQQFDVTFKDLQKCNSIVWSTASVLLARSAGSTWIVPLWTLQVNADGKRSFLLLGRKNSSSRHIPRPGRIWRKFSSIILIYDVHLCCPRCPLFASLGIVLDAHCCTLPAYREVETIYCYRRTF